jgi:hypothetical protein
MKQQMSYDAREAGSAALKKQVLRSAQDDNFLD